VAIQGRPLTILRGSSKTLLLTVRDKGKNLVNLTDAKIFFTIKRTIDSDDYLVRKTSANASEAVLLAQSGDTLGQAQIFLTPTDTIGVDPARDYVYDVWVELVSGKRYPVVKPSALDMRRAVTEDFS
jgi:hypothetical protein